MQNNHTYRVKDLYLAAYLYSQRIELVDVERSESVCWFLFKDLMMCEKLAKEYWTSKGSVIAKEYTDALRTLKDLIFSKT